MNNNSSIKGNNNNVNYNNFVKHHVNDEKYPEVYKIMHPIVSQMITDMENHYGDIEMTDELFKSMVDGVVERSGLVNPNSPMDNNNMNMADAVPTMARDYRHFEGHGHHWDGHGGYHNRSTLGDVASILLLSQLFGGRRPRWRW